MSARLARSALPPSWRPRSSPAAAATTRAPTPAPPSIVPASAPVYFDVAVQARGRGQGRRRGRARQDPRRPTTRRTADRRPDRAAGRAGRRRLRLRARTSSRGSARRFGVFLTTIGADSSDSEGAFVVRDHRPGRGARVLPSADGGRDRRDARSTRASSYELDTRTATSFGARRTTSSSAATRPPSRPRWTPPRGTRSAESDEFTDSVDGLSTTGSRPSTWRPQEFLDAIPEDRARLRGAGPGREEPAAMPPSEPVLGEMTASATDSPSSSRPAAATVETAAERAAARAPRPTPGSRSASATSATRSSRARQRRRGRHLRGPRRRDHPQPAAVADRHRPRQGRHRRARRRGALRRGHHRRSGLRRRSSIQSKDPTARAELIDKAQGLISQQVAPRRGPRAAPGLAGRRPGLPDRRPQRGAAQPIQVVQRGRQDRGRLRPPGRRAGAGGRRHARRHPLHRRVGFPISAWTPFSLGPSSVPARRERPDYQRPASTPDLLGSSATRRRAPSSAQ